MKKEMLINVLQPEETRIAILEDGILEELYVERVSHESFVGNIYKGRVVNIEPSIQAAFIDFGVGRNGFLHISDVDPQYYVGPKAIDNIINGEGDRGDRGGRGERPPRSERPPRGERGSREDGGERRDSGSERGRRGERREESRGQGERREEARGQGDRPEPSRGRGDRRGDQTPREPRAEREEEIDVSGELESGESQVGGLEDADSRDSQQGGPRRRGRRGRGRRKREAAVRNDIPDELLTNSESLPELEDLQIEDDFSRPREPRGGSIAEKVETAGEPRAAEPEHRPLPTTPPPIPMVEPASKPEQEEEVEDSFGAGLLEDEELAFSPPDELPPPEPQRGVYRRIEPNGDEEEGGFGSGLFEDEDAQPASLRDEPRPGPMRDEPRPGPVRDEPRASAEPAAESAGFANFDDEEEAGPEPRVDRYDDEESPLDSWVDFAREPAVEEGVVDAAPPAGREGPREDRPSDEDEDRPRRRRRRGGRGRRGRGREEGPRDAENAAEPAPFELEEDDLGFEEREPMPEPERHERPQRQQGRGDRSGDRRGGRQQGRNGFRGGPGARRPRQRPPIQDIFKRGQEVLVQVIKEGIGNKGPTLSTYISIPGRYLVLMPGLNRVGVSRKIIDDEQRRRLREIVADLERPKGVGFIIRTAGLERSKKELERDLGYLCRLWEVVVRRIRGQKGPATIYQESDMIIRTIRDIFTSEIDTIYIDEPSAYERAREFLQIVMPKYVDRLKLYDKPEPLFHHYGIEEEIAKIQKRSVPLPQGGSIVVDQAEALVAIDVNSGNFRADNNAEETAFQINLAAAKEIARQLRLRDLGGVIVNDFIDMREERHRRAVENALRDAVKRDRARTKILRMSAFGLIEMTRQRIRPSLKRSLYRECAVCRGTGHIKTIESVSIECMRMLAYIGQRGNVRRIQLSVHPEIASYMQNNKRQDLANIEQKWNLMLNIIAKETLSPADITLVCLNADGDLVNIDLGFSPSENR